LIIKLQNRNTHILFLIKEVQVFIVWWVFLTCTHFQILGFLNCELYGVAGLPLALFACFSTVNSKLNIKLEMANKNCKGRICDANSAFWGGGREKGIK